MALRSGVMPVVPRIATEKTMSEDGSWTTKTLYEALVDSAPSKEDSIVVEMVEGADPGILVIMTEFGDLPLLMSVSGSQILVDTLLWPVEDVADPAAFNDLILRTHKLLPLSTFGIRRAHEGKDYYEMFGSLSAGSILESILFEIETLADNAMQAADAYKSDLQNVA